MSLPISTIGALTQAPRHSTSSQEKLPSAETWNWLVMDAALADLHDILGAAQPAGRGAADLDVALRPTGSSRNMV